jgi:L-methionine (R)-S-oxide reductase
VTDKSQKKLKRYARIKEQLSDLLPVTADRLARMASVIAILHHKMDGFLWTGYYFLRGDKLVVGPYQGPVACQELEHGKGVCWASVMQNRTIIVDDVHSFPGHIACDTRSKSEIVVPVRDDKGELIAVLDVDSTNYSNFDDVDAVWLEKIVKMIFL